MSGVSATNSMRQNKIIGLILLVVPSFFFIFFFIFIVIYRVGYSYDKNYLDNYRRNSDECAYLDGLHNGYGSSRKMNSY